MNNHNKLTEENNSSTSSDEDLGTAKAVSAFHVQAERARLLLEEKADIENDPLSRKFLRYKSAIKGKGDGLNDRIKGAGVGDWKDQKLSRFSFFETMRKHFLDKSNISKTFENINIDYSRLPDNYLELEEGFYPKNLTESQIQYINEMGNEMEKVYMKNGLCREEAELRLKTYGPNALPEPKQTPKIIKFLLELCGVFAILLWVAAALALIAYGLSPDDKANLWLAVVIIVVIILTGFFSFFQNEKSGDIIDSFKSFNATTVIVTRDGKETSIPAVNVVKGDVVHIHLGEKVPADLRIFVIEGDLQFDNAPLTGESIAVPATRECGEKGRTNALEATNLAFYSTNCKEGRGQGVCIKIGIDTFMGKIADLANNADSGETTFQIELNDFIFKIAAVSIAFGLIFFALAVSIGYDIITTVIFTLGIICANVPEGLLSTFTVALSITAKKMLAIHIMVKNLQSVETLGSITCICSDKTGTLTKNKMTVVHVFYDAEIKKTNDSQKNLRDEDNQDIPMVVYDTADASFNLFKFSAVCGSIGEFITTTPDDYLPITQDINAYKKLHPEATVEELKDLKEQLKDKYASQYQEEYNKNIDDRYTNTDASESGIIKFFEKIEPINLVREENPLHVVNDVPIAIPFSSDLKYACFLRRCPDNTFILTMKGAPERIYKRCESYLLNGVEVPINEKFNQKFREANSAFALKGERVLGMAYKRLDPNEYPPNFQFQIEKSAGGKKREKGKDPVTNFPLNGLTFAGMVAMEDPPRDGVRDAISLCKKAGIKVIMVTGDQSLTAASIANQIGIIEDIDDTPELIQRREGLPTLEEAEKKSNTIIIEGTRLQAYLDRDSLMSDDNPNKNSFLRDWIMKRDVVFARTSPENKLTIVNACQQLSHVVAVTGDGVNDSPAIKKADIGIAMGKVGTDVAKDAADILLLDDNFPNIIKGIKQGRVIFDILKKIIGYCLSSNICEFFPFLFFALFQIPLPMNSILILCIDVGADVFPNLFQSYEHPETGLMNRPPRNVKTEKLCTIRLFLIGYLCTGILETISCFLTYFVVLSDYGFRTIKLPYFAFKKGIEPAQQDYFNPYDSKFRGNSRAFMREYNDLLGIHGESYELNVKSKVRVVDWSKDADISYDLRVFYPEKPMSFWGKCRYLSRGQSYDDYVCYRIEALRHSNGAYFITAIFMQFANSFNYRTKELSMFKHIMDNYLLLGAIAWTFLIGSLICYVPGLNTAFGTRAIRIEHYFVPLLFHVTHFYYGEIIKFLMRHSRKPDGSSGAFRKYFNY